MDNYSDRLELAARTRDHLLGEEYLDLDEDAITFILIDFDSFLSASRGNECVEEVNFYPNGIDGLVDEYGDKLG
jgi:hypothetical protein